MLEPGSQLSYVSDIQIRCLLWFLTRPAASLTAVSPIPVISKYGSPDLDLSVFLFPSLCIPLSATVLIFESINIPPISPALLYDLSLSPSHGTLCRQICACIWKGRTLQRSSNVSAFLYPPPLPVCRILSVVLVLTSIKSYPVPYGDYIHFAIRARKVAGYDVISLSFKISAASSSPGCSYFFCISHFSPSGGFRSWL